MLRVGVLGAGFMGSTHARAYAQLPDVRVVAIVSQSERRGPALAQELGAAWWTDPQRVIDDPTIDIVDVSLPTTEHARWTIAALRAGKHVLVEKPLALTLAEADAILEAWRASGRILMVGHVLRFWPEYVKLAEIVRSGQIGRPRIAVAYRLSPLPAWSALFKQPERTGGAVVDLQIHDVDQFNWLLGRPRSVVARGVRGPYGGWDYILTTVTYPEAAATAEGSLIMPPGYPFSMGLRVAGEQGVVEYHFKAEGPSVEMGRQAGTRLTVTIGDRPTAGVEVETYDAYAAEVAYFVDCVRRGEQPSRVTPEEARLALQVSLAAKASLETGQEIPLG